ncbi:adenylosuccinate lyase [Streptococcus agalactiae]|uniref:adenylosuccinate lyase n=4 Tax=Streptococcus TaxID=1301 RepID=UPI00376EA399
MISRYSRPEMAAIWTEENKYRAWLEVEILADEAWAELGEIPKEDVAKIREKADFDIDRILEIEQDTRHDVVAFTRAVSETLGEERKWVHYGLTSTDVVDRHDVVAFTRAVSETLGEERKWVHYGLTSTDVVDTAYGYLYKQANDIIRRDLENFTNIVADKAKEHKFTIMMGRTHGVHAEPTTFGLKLATWYSEMKRNIERFEHAAAGVEAGKISGAVGNFANIPPFVEKYVCDKLGIRPQEISTQVLPRDLHAEYFAVLASIATSIERMATEIRGLQKSEQREVEEFFAKGQKGSSAMPHKRNPIGSENMTGLARVIRGHMVTAYENVSLWHERDISHSSAERIITPDTTILIDYMLNRFGNIVKNLTVFPENMMRNMESTFGLIYSQRVMLKLIEKGMTREEAYDLVQPKTAYSWDNQVDFKPLLEEDTKVTSCLTQEEIDELFNPIYYTKRVDDIFERLGLEK